MTQLSAANLDRAFALLVECAVKGERCPPSRGPDRRPLLRSEVVSALARSGRIHIEISARNWRRVTIQQGPHTGRRTAANPVSNATAHLAIDRRGTFKHGKRLGSAELSR